VSITYRDLKGIEGWFDRNDCAVFQAVAAIAHHRGITGDVLEIGGYKGRSSVVLADGLQAGETLHVCDPFEDATRDRGNERENDRSYSTLSRRAFEANVGRFPVPAPVIHQCMSVDLGDVLEPDTFRFVHVDGSHLEDPVRADLSLARRLLGPGGVVVCDDYRSPHTPGTALAVWEAVGAGLVPIVTTPMKLYGSWDPAPDLVDRLEQELASRGCATRRHQRNEDVEILHATAPLPAPRRAAKALVGTLRARLR
jgi:SAM-dependent methyltransferase